MQFSSEAATDMIYAGEYLLFARMRAGFRFRLKHMSGLMNAVAHLRGQIDLYNIKQSPGFKDQSNNYFTHLTLLYLQ